jgi:formylglycine-generating enzyme required for sulfatase activity
MKANRALPTVGWSIVLAALGLAGGCERREANAPARETAAVVPLTNMVRIPAGSFMRMGHRVTVTRDFWLGKFEVTQAEFTALMGRNPSHFDGDPRRPVEKVTHLDASAFCAALTERERAAGHLPPGYEYRLPTEAEWELACRAGSTNLFSFGNDAQLAAEFAWTDENSDGTTHPVGLKAPNAFGLHDMHGNVWEWCRDWFAEFPPVDATDPVGPPSSKFKVFRGGGWNHEVKFARVPNRFMMEPVNGINFVGFRLVLGPKLALP